MKTITLNLIKKNRKYFAALKNGYEVKLLIDDKSDALELGEHELVVEDISVVTKYGTDLIYKVFSEVKKTDKIVTLQSKYNSILVESAKRLGGKWDHEARTWVFHQSVENEVEELDILFNDAVAIFEITAKEDLSEHTSSVDFIGYPIAKAFGRDSGAKIADGVAMISGSVSSGGSAKNWRTQVSAGSVFRIEASRNLIEKFKADLSTWDIKECAK